MQYFSLFSGVGGFELGIKKAMPNTECIGFSEIDKYASAVLAYQFPKIKNYGDIKKINWSKVPDFDLLVGGSPCQDLSVAGKQRGLSGERSGLFYEYIKALNEKKPSNFIWENVKGALSSNEGRDFAEVIAAFSEAGYSLWWQILNAKDFGVPQNRERIFVVGTRVGDPRKVFFEQGENSKNLREITQGVSDSQRVYKPEISKTLSALGGGGGAKTGMYAIPVLTPDRVEKRQNGRRFKTDGEPSFTLNTQDKHGIFDGVRIRRLTPVECERLMGWPDDWTRWGMFNGVKKTISDSQRYKMCGNGVVSNVIEQIILHFIAC